MTRAVLLGLSCAALTLGGAGCRPGLLADEGGGIGAIPGCTADDTVACTGGSEGFTCAAGANPEIIGPSLSCSEPVIGSTGTDAYCCFKWTYGVSSCTPDDELTAACPSGSYAYQCNSPGDEPTSLDPSLHCGAPKPDFDGRNTDFCCTY